MSSSPKVALITGASRGIGRQVAFSLALAGYDLCLIGRHPQKSAAVTQGQAGTLEETARMIHDMLLPHGMPRTVMLEYCDVVNISQCEAVIDVCERKFGRIDVVVLNAIYQGPGAHLRVDNLEMAELQRLFHGNVFGQFAMVKKLLPIFKRQQSGCFITLVSSSSQTQPTKPIDKGGFMSFGYVATKSAIAKLVPILAVEFKELYPKCRFFNVDPGLVLTEAMRMNGTAAKFEKWGVVPASITGDAIRMLVTASDEDALVRVANGAEFVVAKDVVQGKLSKL